MSYERLTYKVHKSITSGDFSPKSLKEKYNKINKNKRENEFENPMNIWKIKFLIVHFLVLIGFEIFTTNVAQLL